VLEGPRALRSSWTAVVRRAGEWRNMEVAIKTVLLEGDPQDKATTAVAREAAIACNLSHPNVVATYSHDVACLSNSQSAGGHGLKQLWPATAPDAFRFYLIQEYCNGKTLRSAVRRGLFSAAALPRRWDALMNILQARLCIDSLRARRAARLVHEGITDRRSFRSLAALISRSALYQPLFAWPIFIVLRLACRTSAQAWRTSTAGASCTRT
jgi:serine/threonine protein kinase